MNLENAKKIFLEVHEVLRKFYIDIFLSDGTMLGAVRDKGFIAWDYDIDSRAAASGWNFSVFDELESNGYECRKSVNSRYQGLISGVNFIKQGIDFGIGFNYYYPPEDVVIFLAGKPSLPSHLQPVSFYRGEHFINFLNIKVRAPHPPTKYIERLYGREWKIPVKDKSWQAIRKRISIEKYVKYFLENPEINEAR